jgi:hypothetical protein
MAGVGFEQTTHCSRYMRLGARGQIYYCRYKCLVSNTITRKAPHCAESEIFPRISSDIHHMATCFQ